MSQLVIVRGLPGSGKTTFATRLAQKHWPQAALFAADDFFTDPDGTYRWDPDKTEEAHKWCQRKVMEALRNSQNVIVHNTFTTSKEFQPYLDMASRIKVDFRVYSLFDGGLTDEELAERNVHAVPVEVLAKMRARWAPAPITEMHVEVVEGYAHWQYPTVKDGEFVYKPDWLEMT